MHFAIFTLFPNFIRNFFQYSLLKRAVEKKIIQYNVYDIKNYGIGNYKKVDDYCYGGGYGMLMRYDVLQKCYLENAVINENSKTIYLSPRGKTLNVPLVKNLKEFSHLNLISSNYEGLDQRFIEEHVDLEISIGDYILTGGELPIMVLVNSLCRFLDEFLESGSLEEESFNNGLVEYDQYTKSNLCQENLPNVLKEGHHEEIKNWQKKSSMINTFLRRIDLWKKYPHQKEDIEMIKDYLFTNYKYLKNKKKN